MSVVRKYIRTALAVTVTLSTGWCNAASAFENGPPPGHTGTLGQPDCTVCHFDNDANARGGGVKLGGVPATYLAGRQYSISVTLEHGAVTTGGFQLAIQNASGLPTGKLDANQGDVTTIDDDNTQRRYIQHSQPRKARDDETDIQWTIVWTAPGGNRDLTVGVAAVAANDDASALGDYVYTATAQMNPCRAASGNEEK